GPRARRGARGSTAPSCSPDPRRTRADRRASSIAVDGGEPFAVERRVAERHLVPARALEPEMEVVLPGETDATVDLERALHRPTIDLSQAGLRDRGGARRLAQAMIEAVGRAPPSRPGRVTGHSACAPPRRGRVPPGRPARRASSR